MTPHIVTVMNSRTGGVAPMMMVNLSDEDSNHGASFVESVESDNGELYLSCKSGTARKFSLDLVLIKAKAKEEGKR